MTAQPQEPAKNPQNKAMLPEIRLRVLDKEKPSAGKSMKKESSPSPYSSGS